MFTTNLGSRDRIARLVIGGVLVVLAFVVTLGIWKWVAILVGAVLIATAFMKFCPIYAALRIRTDT
ncbi:DUF2892 domain-containing protein [Abyssibius alkaniclasticus]|uniref:YgaP family membrane protein n=1 Tax=Abyssibius alkaniclasticus TaxID=2881234 RepID=UPI0023642B7F|nr:DUF2892 domain-containing protein [Abyssibius alkaniclasticus]UPH71267.1 DUF2892 domain-containing protein [Abyssibius alkaniclasticus]|tara:strand:- start:1863 stop:2060 length:198 start_codon:yes stop_codon:yes gene_type:complete